MHCEMREDVSMSGRAAVRRAVLEFESPGSSARDIGYAVVKLPLKPSRPRTSPSLFHASYNECASNGAYGDL